MLEWTDGRALIATGSPFPPARWQGKPVPMNQTNNSYIFPGVGLGVLASGATRVSDGMFVAAAKALAGMSPTVSDKHGRLLPPVGELRTVAVAVATAVARQAQVEGLAPLCDEAVLESNIRANVWEPVYRAYVVTEEMASIRP